MLFPNGFENVFGGWRKVQKMLALRTIRDGAVVCGLPVSIFGERIRYAGVRRLDEFLVDRVVESLHIEVTTSASWFLELQQRIGKFFRCLPGGV